MSVELSSARPLVTMRGRKDGFVFVLDDQCAYDALLDELKSKLTVNLHPYASGPKITVKVLAGNRYLSAEQRADIAAAIHSFEGLSVESIESNVMTRKQFEDKRDNEKIVLVSQVVRSGQVVTVRGSVLLIGDVNPGGVLAASGNVYVLGALRGLACAGNGCAESEALIAASLMQPTQLRIGRYIKESSEQDPEQMLACAYVDHEHGEIMLDKIKNRCRENHLIQQISLL
ncbi:MAG: septum site-determining protein MinC [Sporolactobacillus sp.]